MMATFRTKNLETLVQYSLVPFISATIRGTLAIYLVIVARLAIIIIVIIIIIYFEENYL